MQRACLTLIFMFFTALGGLFATAQPVDGGHARVELVSERQSVDPGETVFAALKMEMDSGWHVYWRNAGDAGLPPQLIVHEASDLPESAIGEFVWPIPHLLPVVDGEIMDYGYDDVLVLPFPITVPADATGPVELSVTADYLICEDVCIPESADVTLTLQTSGPVPNETNGALIADWIAKAPVTLEGEARIAADVEPWQLSLSKPGGFPDAVDIRFYPYGHEINHSAPQPLSRGDEGATLTLTPGYKLGETLDGIVIVETSDGERTGSPSLMRAPATIPAKPTIDPTERSIPPVRITKVIPIPRIALIATCLVRITRFPGARNESLIAAKNPINKNKAINARKLTRIFPTKIKLLFCGSACTTSEAVDCDCIVFLLI